jgi:arsenical pump membrane protein
MMLIVGNPTNIYLAQSAGIGFTEYFKVMVLPTVVGGLTSLGVLLLLFRKQLKAPVNKNPEITSISQVKIDKIPMVVAIFHLFLCIILLAISDFIGFDMWIICLSLAVSLTIFNVAYHLIRSHSIKPIFNSLKKEPYELIPFVLSMFVIVLALRESGVTAKLNDLIITGNNTDAFSIGFLSALSANFLNNIPMSVLFESIISGQSAPALFGAVIGSNIGAFITPVGALAGIMWSKILSEHQIKLPFIIFIAFGTAIAIPTLITSLTTLFLVL